jgi:Type II intron maturase
MLNNRFYPISKPLCETDKKDNKPVTKATITTSWSNGLALNKSRVSVKKSSIEGTARTNPIKFVEGIQSCFDNHSKTFVDLCRVAFAKETLLIAWNDISKKNQKTILEENDNTNLNKVFMCKIKEMSTCLTNSCYKFGSVKKAWVHKKNIDREYLITVMSPYDKIVIHSIYMIFRFIFDGFLHDQQLNVTKNSLKIEEYHRLKVNSCSINYGIKLGKSCHGVLKDVQTWHFCCWFIKINIHKFFDKVNHNRLLNILRETIDDESLLTLLRQIFNKEIFFKKYFYQPEKDVGISQNNNLGLLLANIYLNKLDQFILKRKKINWDKNHSSKNCIHLSNKKTKSEGNVFTNPLKESELNRQQFNFTEIFKQQKIKTAKWMGLKKTIFTKRIFRRVYYTRYVDNFLLGIRGPKFLAIDVRDEISQFIKCNLQLELQFAEVCHTKSNKIKYLGFEIKVPNNTQNHTSKTKSTIALKKLKNRLGQKKSIMQSRGDTFLSKILRKKITNTANWIKEKIAYKIKFDKVINQLIQRELLNTLNDFTLKSTEISKSAKFTDSDKNIPKKSNSHFKKSLRENIKSTKNQNELTNDYNLIKTQTHFLKHLFQITHDNNFKQPYKKKRSNPFNHIICRTLYNYKHNASPRLYAPKKSIIKLMNDWGMTDATSNKPVPNKMLFRYHDLNIILHYKSKAMGLLEYYKPAKNYCWIKKQVNHLMRYSLFFTLAKKHKTSASKIIQVIGKNASIYIDNGSNKLKEVAAFLTPTFIHNKKSGFNTASNPIPNIKTLKKPLVKTSVPKILYHKCQIKNCTKNNIKIFHFRALYKRISPNCLITSMRTHTKKIHWAKVVEFALNKKQISLCNKHHLAIHTGQLFLEDLESNSKSFKLLNFSKLDIKF